jgi:uncharacterized protein YjbI with pentapeptide repeats
VTLWISQRRVIRPTTSARQVPINLTAVDLRGNDFAGVVLHHGKFKASALRGANFAGADLTGSQFQAIDAREANFDGANLTDCNFSATDLTNATFRKSVLAGTTLEMSGQGAKFTDAKLNECPVHQGRSSKDNF